MNDLKDLNDFVAVEFIEARNKYLVKKAELIKRYENLGSDEQKAAFLKEWEERNVTFKELDNNTTLPD